MEFSILRARLKMGAQAKAERGKLKFILPPGYAHDVDGDIVFDPDRRVQKAIAAFFNAFNRFSSIRQLALWYRESQTLFPTRKLQKPFATAWEIPAPQPLRNLLRHPIYAGVYTYGRSRQHLEYVDGRLVKKTTQSLLPDQWGVCIHQHHQAYISWESYLANQEKISESRPRAMMQENLGPLREGLALLNGLLRCGHCGKRIYVTYKNKPLSAMYYCDGKISKEGGQRCLAFGSHLVDKAVAQELCVALAPCAIEAAVLVQQRRNQEHLQAIEGIRQMNVKNGLTAPIP
jgi:hypothetical protein